MGEEIAARYLREEGYILLFWRWRKGSQEIDLIAWDRGELVFVEVRTVSAATRWNPEESLGEPKKAALLRAIEVFYTENPAYLVLPARIDVVAVRLTQPPEVQHWADVFR